MTIQSINRIFNVCDDEWPRITISWGIRFLFNVGFVIGWTILIAMFVIRVGLPYLPYLFIANALLIIVGTFLYSEIIHRVNKETLIVLTMLTAGITLYFATFFPYYSNFIFFGLILTGSAVLLGQLNIIISLFIEDLFSPLESERTFPIIESAETIGGIVGGTIISLLANNIPAYKFLYIWVISILLIIPIIFAFRSYAKKVPFLEFKKKKGEKTGRIKKICEGYRLVNTIPFLKGLLIVILLQWIFINLLEFQYINAIQQSVTKRQEETIVINTELNPEIMRASLLDSTKNREKIQTIKPSAVNYEQSLTQKLGLLHIIFSTSALIVQLLIASRFIKSLGIVGAMMLQPLVMFFNLIGLTLRFNANTAIISKTSFEITHVIYQNACHSSYYSVKQNFRESAREFLEGIIKPFGAVIGMITLLNFQNFFTSEKLTLSINITMVSITLFIFIILLKLRERYTHEATKPLSSGAEYFEKFNAIEILGQAGHKDSGKIIAKNLYDPKENNKIKIKILKTLGGLNDPETIPDILDCLNNTNREVKIAALEALGKFENLGEHVFSQAFSKYRVIQTLNKLFQRENSEKIRSHIIQVLAMLNQSEIADFIIKTLKEAKSDTIKIDCIKACGLFHDPNAAYYIEKYLKSENPFIQGSTIVALWQFQKYRGKLQNNLRYLMKSRTQKNRLAGIHALGEIGEYQYINYLKEHSKHPNEEIQRNAIISLAKIGHEYSLIPLMNILLNKNTAAKEKIKNTLQNIHPKIQKILEQMIHRKASEEINEILNNSQKSSLEELDKKTLKKLKTMYELAKEHQEVLKIEQIIEKR